MAIGIQFPFERGRKHYFRELRMFETQLLAARQLDPELSKTLRNPEGPSSRWIRLRNKELLPMKLFADHAALLDEDQFILMPEGNPIDAQVFASGRQTNLQLTLAAPIWGSGVGGQANSGYQQHQIMRALNENEIVVGYPPFSSLDGVANGEINAVSSEERDKACYRGLSEAIGKKARFDGRGCSLVVWAMDFYCQLLVANLFAGAVRKVLAEHTLNFDEVYVLDSYRDFFIRGSGAR